MGNLSILFFEAYKRLDELCKQILSCDGSGVSRYIDLMEEDRRGGWLVNGWEQDYKQLKRMLHQKESKNKRENIKRQSSYIKEVNQTKVLKDNNQQNESEDCIKGIFYALFIGVLLGLIVLIGIFTFCIF